jgi:hypothetical protein
MQIYSHFVQTLHDETRPTGGYLGRGSHYSILRMIALTNPDLTPVKMPSFHDLAIIWDEDHDIRVIEAIELIYTRGLLSPALFIGERKGGLTVVVSESTASSKGAAWVSWYQEQIESITQEELSSDSWPSEIAILEREGGGSIINAGFDDVLLYLKNISMLWQLGVKPISKSDLPSLALTD